MSDSRSLSRPIRLLWIAVVLAAGGGIAIGVYRAAAERENRDRPQTAAAVNPLLLYEPGPLRADQQINIVLFLVDTLRADRLGCYGYTAHKTSPNIDALAAESVVFEQAYTPAPWTLPTLASLFTGTYPCEHGTLSKRTRLRADLVPLAQRLERMGFATLNLYANVFAGPRFGMGRGFDQVQPLAREQWDTLGGILEQHARPPFFAYLHLIEPHNPYQYAPYHTPGFEDIDGASRRAMREAYKSYRKATRYDFDNKHALGTTDNTAEQDAAMAVLTGYDAEYSILYDASIRVVDQKLADLIEQLRQRSVWDRTLLVVLSDHGEEMNEHGGWLHDQSVYEELMRVPLIIRFPGGAYAGRRVSGPVSLVDLMPTLAEHLEAPYLAEQTRGRSLMPLIRGDAAADDEELFVPGMRQNVTKYYRPWKESRGDINIVVRRGHWKGIWNVEPDTLELYALEQDPHERNEVGAQHPDLVRAMRAYAKAWYDQCGRYANDGAASANVEPLDEATLEKLRSLGYAD